MEAYIPFENYIKKEVLANALRHISFNVLARFIIFICFIVATSRNLYGKFIFILEPIIISDSNWKYTFKNQFFRAI